MAKEKITDEVLPDIQEARRTYEAALAPALTRVRENLQALATGAAQPQVLHIEGAYAAARVAMAHYWAAAVNCEATPPPCLTCQTCLRIGAGLYADAPFLDGRAGNIKVDDVREMRALVSEAPRYGKRRVIMLLEAQTLGIEAANALLKVLEEPNPGTLFVFTIPQRERLLPTLVSRGWVMTLPWTFAPSMPGVPYSAERADMPDRAGMDNTEESLAEWEKQLARFLSTRQSLFAKTGLKGSLDATMAQRLTLRVEKALSDILAGRHTGPLASALAKTVGSGPGAGNAVFYATQLCKDTQEALQAQVNPVLCVEWLATHLALMA